MPAVKIAPIELEMLIRELGAFSNDPQVVVVTPGAALASAGFELTYGQSDRDTRITVGASGFIDMLSTATKAITGQDTI